MCSGPYAGAEPVVSELVVFAPDGQAVVGPVGAGQAAVGPVGAGQAVVGPVGAGPAGAGQAAVLPAVFELAVFLAPDGQVECFVVVFPAARWQPFLSFPAEQLVLQAEPEWQLQKPRSSAGW